jgi:hypothetical protein
VAALDLADFEVVGVDLCWVSFEVAGGEVLLDDFPVAGTEECARCTVTAGEVGGLACGPDPVLRSAPVTARITAATITATAVIITSSGHGPFPRLC